jgi:hypothetical protein
MELFDWTNVSRIPESAASTKRNFGWIRGKEGTDDVTDQNDPYKSTDRKNSISSELDDITHPIYKPTTTRTKTSTFSSHYCQSVFHSSNTPSRHYIRPIKIEIITAMMPSKNTKTESRSFPRKLHALLEEAEEKGFHDLICWQSGGKSFKVLNSGNFAKTIMPKYFKQTKFKSFQRQLNIYGFQRIHHGPNKGGYAHACLIQGIPELCLLFIRQQGASESKAVSAKKSVRRSGSVFGSVPSLTTRSIRNVSFLLRTACS